MESGLAIWHSVWILAGSCGDARGRDDVTEDEERRASELAVVESQKEAGCCNAAEDHVQVGQVALVRRRGDG